MGNLGSKAPDPKDQVKEWSRAIRKEDNKLSRQITAIQREEAKVTKSLKEAAKKGDKDVALILAKEVVNSRKAINRIHMTKANMNSVQMQMKSQLAMIRVSGALESSAEVMKSMQALVKIPEIQNTMMEMSKEMMKAGIIEEMLDDTMSGLEDSEELEDAAQEEVDKVLFEITSGTLGEAPDVLTDTLPAGPSRVEEKEESEPEEDLEEMQSRLQALRS